VEQLEQSGPSEIVIPRSAEYDLTDQTAVRRLFEQRSPEVVIHLAARVGGIGANQMNPGFFFYSNMAMGMNVIEESRRTGVDKIVFVGTTCSNPKFTPVPFSEVDLWNGYPEETNAPYGVAKRALLVMLQAYRMQYGLNGVYLIPANLYGPRDNFDMETSHVIPAMVRKFIEAHESGNPYVTLWGSGKVSREFLYVEDCAEGILLAAERYEDPDPLNLGTGDEVTISELADRVSAAVGFEGEIHWDTSKPDGQPRRQLDITKAKERIGFVAHTKLDDGIRRTVEWYRESFTSAVRG
jgi:GDP-L-fucose synthase